MSAVNKKVDAIGIGVQKSATTWLYTCLSEHPEIRCSSKEEMNYFDDSLSYSKGFEWYHAHFKFGAWKTAEYSPTYFYDKNVPARIHTYNPESKLILSLRNPTERAFSHYRHCLFSKYFSEECSLTDAVEKNPAIIEQGLYTVHLKYFLKYFHFKRIHIILYDDIKLAPDRVLKNLFKFLEVDDQFRPTSYDKKVDLHQVAANPFCHRIIATAYRGINKVFGPSKLIKTLKLDASYREKFMREYEKCVPPLSGNDKEKLLDVYRDDIKKLSVIIDRDLSQWEN